MEKWSKEKAWEWYNKQGWLRGFCFFPSCCVGFFDMWQEYNWEETHACMDRELKIAHEWGFNAIRILTSFDVYLDQHDALMNHLEEFLVLCEKYQLKVMLCLGNDCLVAKENYVPPFYGEQKVEYFYHGGRAKNPFIVMNEPGYARFEEPGNEEKYYQYVDEIVSKYANDPRIFLWDIYNEPGNCCRGMRSYEVMKKSFEIARSHNPIQPCASCCFLFDKNQKPFTEIELKALDMSDVIMYHGYMNFKKHKKCVKNLKKMYGRPLMNTEWLHRIWHNNVFDLFPYFRKHNIACFNWGFVRGKSQTNEPWEFLFDEYHKGNGRDWDFTKWQHDLIRSNGEPYDFKEKEVIERECRIADQKTKINKR